MRLIDLGRPHAAAAASLYRTGLCLAALLATAATALAVPAPAAAATGGAGPMAAATRVGAAPASRRLELVLPLAADEAGLERLAAAVSTVGSPLYGRYESLSALARRFGASAGARARVLGYLRRAGATGVSIDPTGLFADATVSVATAQRLFATPLASFRAARAGGFIAPARQARVPAALRGAVTGVVGLDTRRVFGAPPLMTSHGAFDSQSSPRTDASGYEPRSGTAAGCPQASGAQFPGFTPNQYLTAFGYAPLQAQGLTGQGERVALIEIDGFRYSDLTNFASCFGLRVPAVDAFGVGLRRPLRPGGESTLDLEVLDAAAPGLKEIDVYESHAHAVDVLRSLTAPLHNRGRIPQVMSASLGSCEPELVSSIGFAGVRAAEGVLAEASAAGISVLASSGDAGSTECIGRSGPIRALAQSFPASSPFVTGVGGTNVQLNPANQLAGEVAWNDAPVALAAGGGGPSALFRRPGFQDGWVTIGRRTVPDVSLMADVAPGYDIYCTVPGVCINQQNRNAWVAVGGTSAASPLLAGGLAAIDQALRAQAKPQLGPANSMLYLAARRSAPGSVFTDVTQGSNDLSPFLGDRRPLGCCLAAPGYDWATGLGSPNIAALAAEAVSMSAPLARIGLTLPGQRPLAHHRLLARVSCSRRCWARAVAVIGGRRLRAFAVRSAIVLLRRPGHRTISVALTAGDLRRIRGGLRHHAGVYAAVYGEIVDSGGNVELLSRLRRIRIR